jgi:hypothetical protein
MNHSDNFHPVVYLVSIILGYFSLLNYKPELDFIMVVLSIIGLIITIALGVKKLLQKDNFHK